MNRYIKILSIIIIVVLLFIFASRREIPENIIYGASFSKLHSDELGLDWKTAYSAILGDLMVKHLRLSAHWPMVEPEEGVYSFDELDYQIAEAEKRGADVILAVGRRVPGWPECHNPVWEVNLDDNKRREKLLAYISAVVNRYKGAPNLRLWQVENEPFLRFASQYCGRADGELIKREIELVRELDPAHQILTTDSGEMGLWYKSRGYGDIFGSSLYLYIWHESFGYMRYPIAPGFFKFKENVMDYFFGKKPMVLIELGLEPWLNTPIVQAPQSLQLERMGMDKWKEIISFAQKTGFGEQYLWGAEWWYYMKENGHPEFWSEAKRIFNDQ